MQAVTLAIGLLSAGAIMVLKPLYGLCIYLAVLFLYPSYLMVPVFGFNVSSQRMIVAALLGRIFIDSGLVSKFRLNILDKLVAAMFVVGFITFSITTDFADFAKTYSGVFMDTVLVYFIFRFILTVRRDVMAIIKVVSVVFLIAAAMGVVHCFTGVSIYNRLYSYCPWNITGATIPVNERFGLFRAFGPFGVHIMFGLSFVAFMPLILLLKHERGVWSKAAVALFVAAVLGSMSSVSAGPYLGFGMVFVCLFMKRRPEFIKPALAGILLTVIACEIISNRGFFYVMGRFTFDEANAWYRARLIDVAVMKLPEYWAFGYGMVEPGWGEIIDTRLRTDICNQYVLQTVYHGVGGLAIFISVLWTSIAGLKRFAKSAGDKWSSDAAWFTGSAIVSLAAAFLSVGVFGKFMSVFYALLGITGCFYVGNGSVSNTLIKSLTRERNNHRVVNSKWMYQSS